MNFHIITLFPDSFSSYLGESIIARAIADKKISVRFYNPRDFTKDKWRRIDQKPYSGGPVMVIQALPVIKAIEAALKRVKSNELRVTKRKNKKLKLRYKAKATTEYISVGPFVLTGGELPAMIMIDCIARQVEGVLGNFDSLEESRISSSEVYTRPEVFTYKGKKYRVPKVLLSGNHAEIEDWKKKQK